MTWKEYLAQVVGKLVLCRDEDAFKAVLSSAQSTLDRSEANEERRAWFWSNLKKRFNEAPRLVLSDTTAAAALNELMNVADELIAAASAKR